jgi:hypothetical protein
MSILAEIKKGKRIMNREIDYGRFPRLRAVVAECGLETPEQKESAFRALVNCLVSKMVCKPDGTIVNFRGTCLGYFAQICSHLEPEELELMVNSVESFYQRFIFAPCEKAKSLYSEFQKLGVKSAFRNIPISEIYEEYRQETGYSPYEKATKQEISSFLDSVEPSMYALA